MMIIRDETHHDIAARESLLDGCFGAARFRKTCQRLRAGRLPADSLALVVDHEGALAGSVRLWSVAAGSAGASLMLGPIAVDPRLQGIGIGARLMREALSRARALGHRSVLLVGDAPYYRRFGFATAPTEGLYLPGPYLRERFLGLELSEGALSGAAGLVTATGAFEGTGMPDLAAERLAAQHRLREHQPAIFAQAS